MKRKILLLPAIAACLFSGCMQDIPSGAKNEQAFQAYYAYSTEFDALDGFYYTDFEGFLYYFDYDVKKESIVCNKPNCKHESWQENTPKEQRCSAYLGGMSTGFSNGQKLYIMESFTEDTHRIRIVESDLDRTNQREVKLLDCDSIYSYAVKDSYLYAVIDKNERIRESDGTVTNGYKKKASLCKIDLTDGSIETLLEKSGFSSVISILDAENDNLYCSHSYFEKPFDGTNFKEAKQHVEYYKYSCETGEFQEILQELADDQILSASVVNGDFFAKTTPKDRSMNEGEKVVCELKKIDLDTKNMKTLAYTTERQMVFPNYAVYTKDGEEGGFVYDFWEEKEIAVPDMQIENFYPQYTAGPYLYGNLQEKEKEASLCFILYEDFITGKNSFIPVHT